MSCFTRFTFGFQLPLCGHQVPRPASHRRAAATPVSHVGPHGHPARPGVVHSRPGVRAVAPSIKPTRQANRRLDVWGSKPGPSLHRHPLVLSSYFERSAAPGRGCRPRLRVAVGLRGPQQARLRPHRSRPDRRPARRPVADARTQAAAVRDQLPRLVRSWRSARRVHQARRRHRGRGSALGASHHSPRLRMDATPDRARRLNATNWLTAAQSLP